MAYKLVWKAEAKEEFEKLDNAIKRQALVQFRKLQEAPQLGQDLGKKLGLDLTGYQKLSFYRQQYRIVYRVDEQAKKVTIYAIGPRESEEVYREVAKRIKAGERNEG
ncbi:type II toxin-antitoxin system RelE/ParE family toxin [Candidatus Acetothermia bacterium]|jgi:mRNA interferase RelE/StbE|nr:type II toxin-antitoxin system RelE/ParE family toxin [Candidatus Acetothermia bacterium]MCI2432273.1 type II toxin-antitoxin system RelE/ParE family toxin [Candidatus Acetothermia bacterium]MCI2436529.1 type II toxin-antitoxin system RelE/ParE family toxin [Candidatus Acetothermia bacterium]